MKKILLITLLLSSCDIQKNDNPCTHEGGHQWGKWEELPDDSKGTFRYLKRTCEHCGWMEADCTLHY